MEVSSYLEIYLTQFGWALFDEIWDVIADTGLAFLPFIGMFARNIIKPLESQEPRSASETSLHRVEIDTIAMFFTIVLAVQPYMSISYTGLSYTKACTANNANATVTGGNTGTSYDQNFTQATLGGTNARIPIWWYAVLALSGAFNNAVIVGIPCSTDIRLVSFKMANSRIQDPQVRNQTQLFYRDCYTPAMADFLNNNRQYPANLPQNDLYWLGSQYFLNNYYQNHQSTTEIPGFPYNPNRDLQYDPNVYIPANGKPTCAQWWTGAGGTNGGLRNALVGQVNTSTLTQFQTAVASAMANLGMSGSSQTQAQNIAIKTLVSRESGYFNGLKDLNMYNQTSVGNAANSLAATMGGWMESMQYYPKVYMLKASAPIVQAVVLMLIYMLMPIYFWFSSYDVGKMIFMTIVIFSIKFWTVLWAVANWLDNNLLSALNPGWFNLQDAFTQNNFVIETVVSFVTTGVFVFVPLFWSGMLGWAGYKIGGEMMRTANNLSETPASAGAQGGGAAKEAAQKSLKK